MRSLVAGLLVPLCAALPTPASAQSHPQPEFRAHVVTGGIALGGAAFSDFQRVEQLAGGAEFDRRVSAQTTVAVSAALTYWFSRYWAIRGHASYLPTRFVLRAADDGVPADEAPSYARLGIVLADADILFRPPVIFGRVAPYGIVGGGIVEYRTNPNRSEPLPMEAEDAFGSGSKRRFAGVFGIGAIIPLDRHAFHLNFELTNHLTRSPVDPPPSGTGEGGVVIDPDGWRDQDDGAGLTSHMRLMVGITMPFGF